MEKDLSAINRENLNLNGDYYGAANYAFTLAEVLITIGVIGIVAAIALPSLINHYNDKVLETRYKKSKNILINGYKLMMAKEQVFDIKDLSVMKCQDMDCFVSAHKEVFKTVRDSSSSDISEAFASDYTIPGVPEKQDFSSMASQLPAFQITDGMSFIAFPNMPDNGSMGFYADLNGKSEPNIAGEDFFLFSVSGNGVFTDMTSMMLPECTPETISECKTREGCRNLSSFYEDKKYSGGCRDYGFSWSESTGTCFRTRYFSQYCS